jgi:gluconolactonase
MIGVILSVENKGNYFLKLTGPDKTVAEAADDVRLMIGGDVKQEKPYED